MNAVSVAKLWVRSFTQPHEAFKKERGNADYKLAFLNIIAAAVLATIIKLLVSVPTATMLGKQALVIAQFRTLGMPATTALAPENLLLLISTNFLSILLLILLGWAVGGAITNKISQYLTGEGDLKTQLYLTSLFMPAFGILGTILSFIGKTLIILPILSSSYQTFTGAFYAWAAVVVVFFLYNIRLYILALAETHKYGEGAGLSSCIIGIIVLGIIFAIVAVTALGGFLNLLFI